MVRSQHVLLVLLGVMVALLVVIAWQLVDDDALPLTLENAYGQAGQANDDVALATISSRNGEEYLAVITRSEVRRSGSQGGMRPVRCLTMYYVDGDGTLRVKAIRRIEWDPTVAAYNCSETDMGTRRTPGLLNPEMLERNATRGGGADDGEDEDEGD